MTARASPQARSARANRPGIRTTPLTPSVLRASCADVSLTRLTLRDVAPRKRMVVRGDPQHGCRFRRRPGRRAYGAVRFLDAQGIPPSRRVCPCCARKAGGWRARPTARLRPRSSIQGQPWRRDAAGAACSHAVSPTAVAMARAASRQPQLFAHLGALLLKPHRAPSPSVTTAFAVGS